MYSHLNSSNRVKIYKACIHFIINCVLKFIFNKFLLFIVIMSAKSLHGIIFPRRVYMESIFPQFIFIKVALAV